MLNGDRLRDAIISRGLKYSFIAENLNINLQSLQRKIDGIYDFKLSEVNKLIELLNFDWEKDSEEMKLIFFADFVEKKETKY